MKKNEIKEMVERVKAVQFIAEDGTVFYSEAECREYEESALFAVSKNLKRLTNKWTSIYDLNGEYCEENELEIFDIKTKEDLENLRRYLYLKLTKNGATETIIKDIFSSENRKEFRFDNITIGHEVLIYWSYDSDWAWTYGDGSLEGYFNYLRGKYAKLVTPEEPETKS